MWNAKYLCVEQAPEPRVPQRTSIGSGIFLASIFQKFREKSSDVPCTINANVSLQMDENTVGSPHTTGTGHSLHNGDRAPAQKELF